LLTALSSSTARELLSLLHDEPATPSELADRVDTSLQNVQYHLDRLSEAGAVEVADTAYSEKGREMDIYAPADRALVVVGGKDEDTSGIRAAVARLLGGLGVLALASVLLQMLVDPPSLGGPGGADAPPTDGGAGGGATATPTPRPTAMPEATPAPTPAQAPGGPDPLELIATLPPGALFFLGGATVLVVGFVLARRRR
jgi:DNA-binding transcriptional ArsR family regulator